MYPIQRSHIHLSEIWDTIQNLLCRKITSHPVTLSHWSLRMTDLFAGIEKGLIQTVRVFVQFEPPKLPPRLLKDRNIAKSIYSASCAIKSVFGRFITITNYSLAWSCTAVVSNTHVALLPIVLFNENCLSLLGMLWLTPRLRLPLHIALLTRASDCRLTLWKHESTTPLRQKKLQNISKPCIKMMKITSYWRLLQEGGFYRLL